MPHHAIFSEKQKQLSGSVFYYLVDSKEEIEITSAATDKDDLDKIIVNFPDAQYLGVVGNFARLGHPHEGKSKDETLKTEGYILKTYNEEFLVKDPRRRFNYIHHEKLTHFRPPR